MTGGSFAANANSDDCSYCSSSIGIADILDDCFSFPSDGSQFFNHDCTAHIGRSVIQGSSFFSIGADVYVE